jgi:hypothetical protein
MEWRAATMLVPTLTTLRRLELTLVSGDTNHKAFQAIGTLTELRYLHLDTAYPQEKRLHREEILAIGKLHKLRHLEISGGSTLNMDNSVTNDDLIGFLSSFPKAERIEIRAFSTSLIPSSAMIALATTSKRLRFCEFFPPLDLGFVDSSTPLLFPKLEEMYCRRLYCPEVPTKG